jgi:hypothetical protein
MLDSSWGSVVRDQTKWELLDLSGVMEIGSISRFTRSLTARPTDLPVGERALREAWESRG